VLRNLLDNAIRHTPPGGEVQVRANPQAEVVLITVKDTGEGVAPEDLPRIFDRFYRGDAARSRTRSGPGSGSGGAGLGLAIAKGLVEAHQGRIWAESAPGRGTVLKIRLPKTGRA
jgi:signal transduction histidine kinase